MKTAHLTLLLALLLGACSRSAGPPKPLPDPLTTVRAGELYRHGIMLARGGDDIRAEQYFLAAMARGYPEREVLPLLVRVCIRSSRYRTALAHTREVLRNRPEDDELRLLIASLYLAAGQRDQARDELERVIDENPQLALAHYALAELMVKEEEWRDAGRHLQVYLDLDASGVHAPDARRRLRQVQRETRRARRRR